jgi:hypothetical protein
LEVDIGCASFGLPEFSIVLHGAAAADSEEDDYEQELIGFHTFNF